MRGTIIQLLYTRYKESQFPLVCGVRYRDEHALDAVTNIMRQEIAVLFALVASTILGDVFQPNLSDFVSVKDAQFGAKGDLRYCVDMQIARGSVTLYVPASCNLTPGDVGKWVQVPLAGDRFGTGLSAQITAVQDAQHALLNIAAGATVGPSPKSYSDLAIPTQHTNQTRIVYSRTKPFTPNQVGAVITITGGTNFTTGKYTIKSVDYAGRATLDRQVAKKASTGGTGSVQLFGTIASGDYDAITAAAKYACSHSNSKLIFPQGIYYLERYRIEAGPYKNGFTDINWLDCHDVTVSGYGAKISSNGSFRRITDNGHQSWENTVSPFRVNGAINFTLEGIELDGNVDKTTNPVSTAEGQDHGFISGGSKNLTLRDVNSHHWSADGLIVGLLQPPYYLSDQIVHFDHIWTHNNGRQGLTIANLRGFTSNDYQCSQIGPPFLENYGGHAPASCVDIEPPVAADLPDGAMDIHFSGGYVTSAFGTGFVSTANICNHLLIEGIIFDNSKENNDFGRGGGSWMGANCKYTLFRDNIVYTQATQGFGCSANTANPNIQRVDIIHDHFVMDSIPEISCGAADGKVHPIHFLDNHVWVKGTAVQNGAIRLDHVQEVAGNTFVIGAGAKFAGIKEIINYSGADSVHDNIYSTDLPNAADPYAVSYTNVRLWRNEHSLNPTCFVVIPDGP